MSNIKDVLLDPVEAAAILGVSSNWIRLAARSGKLRHTRIGNRYFFQREDLTSLIKIVEPHNHADKTIE